MAVQALPFSLLSHPLAIRWIIMADTRPSPDALSNALKNEEARQIAGKLKVFLGMSPGVGKTYAMLEAARGELAAGTDVVIGYVETHGRKETDALAEGLPVIPRKTREHRGTTLTEMDLDAILARRPQLAIVDELAHTNAPGSQHPKRWQDVKELLDAGINVFTTINVQHLDKRVDAVRQITGAEKALASSMCEDVPFSVIVSEGPPDIVILWMARALSVDAIVMGPRLQGGLSWMRRNTVRAVLRQTPCPIYIVKPMGGFPLVSHNVPTRH